MSDFEKMFAQVKQHVRAKAVDAGQMTLGEFISQLETAKPATPIVIDFAQMAPTDFDSYRGYYDQLALGFEPEGAQKTVEGILADARKALGATFTGYKGGDYVMAEDTPLWVSNYGRSSDVRIVGLDISEYGVTIKTLVDDG